MSDWKVTVCDKCLCASCWYGILLCAESSGAGTVQKLASELDSLKLEHPSWYSVDEIRKHTGHVEYVDSAPESAVQAKTAQADASERMAEALEEYIIALDASAEMPGVIGMNMTGYFNERFRAALQAYKETKK